ncbi:hypothetical protein JCM6882_002677 [Rhodosporidiobolus microsporus]
MESPGCVEPTDRLSTLPVELVERIFELAYEDKKHTATGPISRALLPFDRKERFKHVEVKSTEQFVRLVSTVREISVHKFIRTLACTGVEDTLAAPSEQEIKFFLGRLSRLSHLALKSACAPILRVVLSAFYARVHPPSLTSVTFCPSAHWDNPVDPSNFARPATFRTLTCLNLELELDPEHVAQLPYQLSPVALPFVEHLTLHRSVVDLSAVATLANSCPSLQSLELDSTVLVTHFHSLIPLLLPQLRSLRLKLSPCPTWPLPAQHPCDHLLHQFSQLTELHLGNGHFSHHTLLASLSALPSLSRLTFGRGACVFMHVLLAFVDGSTRLPSLSTLTLDIVERGTRGQRLPDDLGGKLHPDGSYETFRMAPGWTEPPFDLAFPFFSPWDLIDLVAAGQAQGVVVGGEAIEAAHVFIVFREEAQDCLVAYGLERGDFTELAEVFGEEEAQEIVNELGLSPTCSDEL